MWVLVSLEERNVKCAQNSRRKPDLQGPHRPRVMTLDFLFIMVGKLLERVTQPGCCHLCIVSSKAPPALKIKPETGLEGDTGTQLVVAVGSGKRLVIYLEVGLTTLLVNQVLEMPRKGKSSFTPGFDHLVEGDSRVWGVEEGGFCFVLSFHLHAFTVFSDTVASSFLT